MVNVKLEEEILIITFPRDGRILNQIRSLPVRRFHANDSSWRAPYVRENWDALHLMGFPLKGIPRPERSAYFVDVYKKSLILFVPPSPENVQHCRTLPDTRAWNDQLQGWTFHPTTPNVRHVLECWPNIEWSPAAQEYANAVEQHLKKVQGMKLDKNKPVKITDYKFSGKLHPDTGTVVKPMEHQVRVFGLSREREAFALFMEQGTGKSRVIVDTACYLFQKKLITGVLVIAPNSMKDPWVDEVELMSPEAVRYRTYVHRAGGGKAAIEDFREICQPGKSLAWLIINIEAFSSAKGLNVADDFMKKHRVLMVVDESTSIKSNSAKRSKNVIKVGKGAAYRRVLTGTPVTQGPLDLYVPFKFLDPAILGYGSYYSFRNHFAEMGGFGGKQIIHYINLDELQRLIDPHSFRVLRSECLDLPPKQYQKLVVELSPEQRRIYNDIKEDMLTSFSGMEVSVTMVLTQLLRLQQIVGGFLPVENVMELDNGLAKKWYKPHPVPGANPKIEALLEFGEDIPENARVIVWARFRAEIELIANALRKRYGDAAVVEFHGGVKQADRNTIKNSFQDMKSPVRWFIGQHATGGRGLTLTAASYVVYFSNTFSLEERLQTEDRAHRIGQTKSVVYIDIVASKTIDSKLIAKLRGKKKTANIITGDAWTEWL
jgi:hypothetical protein